MPFKRQTQNHVSELLHLLPMIRKDDRKHTTIVHKNFIFLKYIENYSYLDHLFKATSITTHTNIIFLSPTPPWIARWHACWCCLTCRWDRLSLLTFPSYIEVIHVKKEKNYSSIVYKSRSLELKNSITWNIYTYICIYIYCIMNTLQVVPRMPQKPLYREKLFQNICTNNGLFEESNQTRDFFETTKKCRPMRYGVCILKIILNLNENTNSKIT